MHEITSGMLLQMLDRQKASWRTVADNYSALEKVMTRRIVMPHCNVTAMHNPARILSTASKPDSGRTNPDSCFLCAGRRPAEQEALPFAGKYSVLVNPYPVFKRHFTIAAQTHTGQRIAGRFGDMLLLARLLDGYTIFYNGPGCGASAPHHAHFQAVESGAMPIEGEWHDAAAAVTENRFGKILRLPAPLRNAFVIESGSAGYTEEAFAGIYAAARHGNSNSNSEPMMNILSLYAGGKWEVFVFLRKAHRPSFYGSDGEGQMLVSPASVEMGGVLVLPRKEDFDKMTERTVTALYNEVCIDSEEADSIASRLKSTAIWTNR